MVEILEMKTVKTRKDHCCWGCDRKFEKGNNLNVIKSVDGGSVFSTYWCMVCQEYWNKYMQNGDEIYKGELKSEDFDTWKKIRIKQEVIKWQESLN